MAGQASEASPGGQRDRARSSGAPRGGRATARPGRRPRAPVRPSRSGAPRTGRRSTGWRATGCRDRPAGGCAVPAWRCRPRCGAAGTRPLGCGRATALKRAHDAAISSRCAIGAEMRRRAEGVLNQRVLLHRRQHHARRLLHGGHEVGRPGQYLVGRLVLLVGLDRRRRGPTPAPRRRRPRLSRDAPAATAASAWLITSCCETPSSHSDRARPGRPDASGDGATRIDQRPRALGHQRRTRRSAGGPGRRRPPRPPTRHRS